MMDNSSSNSSSALLLADDANMGYLSDFSIAIYARHNESARLRQKRAVKDALDRSAALVFLILLLPLFVVIGTMILCDSRGGVFFRQKRHGLHGKVFEIVKFRTMHMTFCDDGVSTSVRQVTRNDPRVTRFGRLLRQTSLDELPQLINVLLGEMSFVGPRPHAVAHDRMYEKLITNYVYRFQVKPGITGLAQVEGLRGPTATLDLMERRINRDLDYIASWSLKLDFLILLRTLLTGFRHEKAF